MKGRWNSVSEEDAHRPISELHVAPSVTPETRGHQNVTTFRARGQSKICGAHHQGTRKMWVPKLDHKEGERTAISEGKKKEENTEKSKGMVTLPYIKGVTKQRILNTADFKTLLVPPKDKVEDSKKTVYTRSLARAVTIYISETGRTFGTRLKNTRRLKHHNQTIYQGTEESVNGDRA